MAISVALRDLLNGQLVASSRLGVTITEELMHEGLLAPVVHGSRKSYRARDVESLRRYLLDKGDDYRLLEVIVSDGDVTRASLAAETGNSKLVQVRSCPGFPVNAYEPITCRLNGRELVVEPQEGTFLFVTDWSHFEVPEDVIIVGIENMENFRMIRQQRKLMESVIGHMRILFVSRYPQSTDMRSWLQMIPNRYVHFGDFDLAGINIYLTEFHAHIGTRSSFLIPSDIDERLAKGSIERYNDQYARYKHLTSDIKEIQALIDLINKYHRCYDQEGYIK